MLNKMFDEFNKAYDLKPKTMNDDLTSMHGLIQDELVEFHAETSEIDRFNGAGCPVDIIENSVKEAIDVIYITCQQLRERGVDVDLALNEVHRSNMSKELPFNITPHELGVELSTAMDRYPNAELFESENGFVIKCTKSGKVVKPIAYSPAVINSSMTGL